MNTTMVEQLRTQLEELDFQFLPNSIETFLHEESQKERPLIESLTSMLDLEICQKRQRSAKTRLKISRLPQVKRLEDFDTERMEGVSRKQIKELASLSFIARKDNVVFMGPSGLGKTHLLLGLCHKACMEGYTSYFLTCMELVDQLSKARQQGRFRNKIKALCKPHLLAIDEIGYHNLSHEEAQMFFQLVADRYEKGSMVLTTNKSFGQWSELMGEQAVATATLDRLLHHSHVYILKGDSYRLKNRIKNGLVPRNNN